MDGVVHGRYDIIVSSIRVGSCLETDDCSKKPKQWNKLGSESVWNHIHNVTFATIDLWTDETEHLVGVCHTASVLFSNEL